MAQSVELTLDASADEAIRTQWRRLADAGLPSSQRLRPSPHHRPHLTLFAGDVVSDKAELELAALMTGLDLSVRIGALMVFGPRRDSYVLVRQVVASIELLELQARIATTCGANADGQFGPGLWTPHVTLAPRIRSAQVGPALDVLDAPGAAGPVTARVTDCRRWDSERRTAWWLTR